MARRLHEKNLKSALRSVGASGPLPGRQRKRQLGRGASELAARRHRGLRIRALPGERERQHAGRGDVEARVEVPDRLVVRALVRGGIDLTV